MHLSPIANDTYYTPPPFHNRAAGAERLMFPVERYLWLFPNDVRRLVGGAQQREGCASLCVVNLDAVMWWSGRGG